MISCDYHPDEVAVARCERCHRKLCLNDRMIYRMSRRSDSVRYTESYEYCPLCYHDAQIRDGEGNPKIILLLLSPVLLFILLGSFGSEDLIIIQVSFVAVITFVLFVLVMLYSDREATAGQKEFLSSLPSKTDEYPSGIRPSRRNSVALGIRKKSFVDIECLQCGSILNLEDYFCPNCGDTTEDEKEYYGLS